MREDLLEVFELDVVDENVKPKEDLLLSATFSLLSTSLVSWFLASTFRIEDEEYSKLLSPDVTCLPASKSNKSKVVKFDKLSSLPGLGVSHAIHLVLDFLFLIKQTEHIQISAGAAGFFMIGFLI